MSELREAVVGYHTRLQEIDQQNQAAQPEVPVVDQAEALLAVQEQLHAMTEERDQLRTQAAELEHRWVDLQQGRGWKVLQNVQSVRVSLFPPGSAREKLLNQIVKR